MVLIQWFILLYSTTVECTNCTIVSYHYDCTGSVRLIWKLLRSYFCPSENTLNLHICVFVSTSHGFYLVFKVHKFALHSHLTMHCAGRNTVHELTTCMGHALIKPSVLLPSTSWINCSLGILWTYSETFCGFYRVAVTYRKLKDEAKKI